jgi:EmrB/QacA subfamily drug resistance transporter
MTEPLPPIPSAAPPSGPADGGPGVVRTPVAPTSAPGAAHPPLATAGASAAAGGAAAGVPTTHGPSGATPAPEAVRLTHAQIRVILIGVILAMFLGALDQTIVVTALPTIGREMQSVEQLSWVVTAYLLTATAATPIYGKLSDIHGRRIILLIAIGIFLVGSVACALATDIRVLILARALQGAGGGGLISLGQTIVADIIPPRERGRYMAYFAAVFMTASIAGPALGGILSEHLHWSAIFWINLPLGLAAYLLTNRVLKKIPTFHRPHKIDYAGAGLMLVATFTLMLALSWGGVDYGWSSAPILGLVALSVLLWAAFAWRLAGAPEPFVPISLLANRIVSTGVGAVLFAVGTMVALSVFLPLYFEAVFGFTAAESGLALIAHMAGTVTGAQIAGRIMGSTGRYKLTAVIGLAVAAATALAMAAWPPLGLWQMEVMIAILGMGLGVIYPISTVSVQNAVPAHQMGTATGILNFARSLGGALVVPAFGALFLAGAAVADGMTTQEVVLSGTLAGAEIAPAFRSVFLATAAGAIIACIFMATIPELPLRGHEKPAD